MHLCGFQVVVEGEEGAGVFFSHCEDGSILGGGARIQGLYASAEKGLG